jgi:hypothetical protein
VLNKGFSIMSDIKYSTQKQESARHLTGAEIDPSLANMKSIASIDQAMEEVKLSPAEVQDDEIIKAKVFEFARALLNVELCTDIEMTPSQKTDLVKRWWNQNNIPRQLDEEMEQEICNAVLKAELPIFNSPLSHCRALAEKQIAEQYGSTLDSTKKNRQLLKLTLFELQTLTGPKPFYSSASKLEESLGLYSAKHWWELLNRLEVDEVIKKIRNGKLKGRKASEFIILHHPCWEQDEAAKAEYKKLKQSVSIKNRVLKSVKKRQEMRLILDTHLDLKEIYRGSPSGPLANVPPIL